MPARARQTATKIIQLLKGCIVKPNFTSAASIHNLNLEAKHV
jgi:hypothetical protein